MQIGSPRRQLTFLLVFLLLTQVTVLVLVRSRLKYVGELHTELLQIDELRTELHALRAAALDAETGQRGFVITGREEFLQPYRAAVLTFQPRLDRLRILVGRNPALKQRASALSAQLLLAQTEMARLVELRRHDGFEAAKQKMIDGTQREAMDSLRVIALDMDEEEQHQAESQERHYRIARATLIGLAFGGFCIDLLITVGLGVFMLRRLRTFTGVMGKPLVDISRGLRMAAKTAARDATTLAEFAKTDADAKAEGQATLDVITRMAKDLSTVAMEITSSVREVADGPEAGQEELYTAQIDRVVALAGRVAQSALSLELTTAEQRRVFDGTGASLIQLEQSVKSLEQAASRIRKIAKDLVRLLQVFPGLLGRSASETVTPEVSDSEILPV